MGAHDYICTYTESDQAKVRKLWDHQVEEDKYESGSGAYAGNATTMHGRITFYDRRLASQSEAAEFVLNKHQKWDGPIACSYYLPEASGKRDEARQQKARERVNEAQTKLNEANAKVRVEFGAAKSKMVGCKDCGSRMSREHLVKVLAQRPIRCPLCNGDLLSQTFRERQVKLEAKLKEAQEALNEALKPRPSTKIGWVVGGWAAS